LNTYVVVIKHTCCNAEQSRDPPDEISTSIWHIKRFSMQYMKQFSFWLFRSSIC